MMRILIFGHFGHLEEYAEYIRALKKADSIQSLYLTMGRHECERARKLGLFDAVKDILPSQTELDAADTDRKQAVEALTQLEKRLGSTFVNRDILMDRYFRGQPVIEIDLNSVPVTWTASRTKQFMSLISRRLEEEIGHFDPEFVLLEPVTAPFRMAWRLAHEKGIPAGKFMPVRFWPGRLYLESGLGYDWERARNEYHQMPERPLTDDELAEVKQRLATIRGEKIKPTYLKTVRARGAPSFIKRLYFKRLFAGLYAWLGMRARTYPQNPHVLPSKIFSPIAKYVRYRKGQEAKKFLLKHQTPFAEIQKRRYAVYFLHVQPEVTVDGMSFDYQDQENTIRNILASLPADMDLVIKEHSPMLGFRPLERYTELAHMPGVVFAETHEDSHKLIGHAAVVVTLTSTVALEAILYGIPAIVLGSIYFDCFNGIYKPGSLHELRELLAVPERLAGATEEDAVRTLASMLRASSPGQPPLGDSWTLREVDLDSATAMMSELRRACRSA